MKFEEFKYVDETLENIYSKLNEEEKTFISDLVTKFNQKCEENEDFKKDKESLNKCGFANAIQLLLAYGGLQEENMYLQQENQSLKDRIEKAIDYINKIELDNYDIYTANILLDRNDDLLEILKGDKEC